MLISTDLSTCKVFPMRNKFFYIGCFWPEIFFFFFLLSKFDLKDNKFENHCSKPWKALASIRVWPCGWWRDLPPGLVTKCHLQGDCVAEFSFPFPRKTARYRGLALGLHIYEEAHENVIKSWFQHSPCVLAVLLHTKPKLFFVIEFILTLARVSLITVVYMLMYILYSHVFVLKCVFSELPILVDSMV